MRQPKTDAVVMLSYATLCFGYDISAFRQGCLLDKIKCRISSHLPWMGRWRNMTKIEIETRNNYNKTL